MVNTPPPFSVARPWEKSNRQCLRATPPSQWLRLGHPIDPLDQANYLYNFNIKHHLLDRRRFQGHPAESVETNIYQTSATSSIGSVGGNQVEVNAPSATMVYAHISASFKKPAVKFSRGHLPQSGPSLRDSQPSEPTWSSSAPLAISPRCERTRPRPSGCSMPRGCPGRYRRRTSRRSLQREGGWGRGR